MSLNYNILWVDDKKEKFEELDYPKEIIKFLEDQFYTPNINFYETIEDAEKSLENNKYDVIFSDYNINADDYESDSGKEKTGEDFLRTIRKNSVNTEVLFYTAQKNLPTPNLDRISYLQLNTPNSYSDLLDKMKSLISLTVERLNDLTNLRGLIMSEVSELDDIMDKIITKYFESNNISELSSIIKDREKSIKKKLVNKDECGEKCILKIQNEGTSINDILKEFDSAFKARAINKIIEKLEYSYQTYKNNFYEDYNENIIVIRNKLAHCTSDFKNGKEILKTRAGDELFDKDKINIIRNNIKNYNTMFNNIYEIVSR